jgi:hypothetical protein
VIANHFLGRRPRERFSWVPHYSALIAGIQPPPAPSSLDYTKGLPADLGQMLNNSEGDCAEAGYGHYLQVDSFLATGSVLTLPDSSIQALAITQGLDPNNPAAFGGTVLQSLLSMLVTGITMPDGTVQKLFAFVEVDPRNDADLNLVTYQCGALYVGSNIPTYLENYFSPGSTWDIDPSGDNSSAGGHCWLSAKYAPSLAGRFLRGAISWGSSGYEVTPAFWDANVDECYGLLSPEAITRNGGTFAGLTIAQWEQQMNGARMAGT